MFPWSFYINIYIFIVSLNYLPCTNPAVSLKVILLLNIMYVWSDALNSFILWIKMEKTRGWLIAVVLQWCRYRVSCGVLVRGRVRKENSSGSTEGNFSLSVLWEQKLLIRGSAVRPGNGVLTVDETHVDDIMVLSKGNAIKLPAACRAAPHTTLHELTPGVYTRGAVNRRRTLLINPDLIDCICDASLLWPRVWNWQAAAVKASEGVQNTSEELPTPKLTKMLHQVITDFFSLSCQHGVHTILTAFRLFPPFSAVHHVCVLHCTVRQKRLSTPHSSFRVFLLFNLNNSEI